MTEKDLKEWLNEKMFRPFRMYLSDGSVHTIWRREQVTVAKRTIAFGVLDHPDQPEDPDRIMVVALLHINRIEPLAPTTAA
jgi:hypothetical protein